jgi:hypothetical protein
VVEMVEEAAAERERTSAVIRNDDAGGSGSPISVDKEQSRGRFPIRRQSTSRAHLSHTHPGTT